MASNPGHIPAGGREKISVVVNTRNRGGSTLHKGFKVFTNDPAKPEVTLQVTGKVKGYLTVAPAYVRLNGAVGQSISRKVQIVAMKGYPFTIKEINAHNREDFQYRLTPMDKQSGRQGYVLQVENTKQKAGNYYDTIVIKTDSKHKPVVRIPVYGRIHDPAPGSGQPKP